MTEGKRPGRPGPVALLLAALVAAGVLGACSGWEARDGTCVREHSNEVTSRVINRADPELCDRPVKKRGEEYLRVSPP